MGPYALVQLRTFRRVIRSASGLPAQTIISERDRLRDPLNPLEDDERLKPIVDEVNAEIAKLLGIDNALRLRLTATDSDSVLESVVPHFVTGDGNTVPSKRQGSGLISLQSLFLRTRPVRAALRARWAW